MSEKLSVVLVVKGEKVEVAFAGADHERAKIVARNVLDKPPAGLTRVSVLSEKMGTFFHRKHKSLPLAETPKK